MEPTTLRPDWMNDESVQNIPQNKLDFLARLFVDGKGKSSKEMMGYLIPMMKKAKAENLSFSQSEITACIQAIKKHSTKEELNQIDKILSQHNK